MNKLTTSAGVFGPFDNVQVMGNHYLADGCILPFTVYGSGAVISEWDIVPVIPVEVPQSVTMRQARLALLGAGMLDDVNAAIAALPEPDKSAALIEWEYASEVQRSTGLVANLGAALGLTEPQLDDLFIQAAQL
ncbi:MAG: hypothetical protein RL323_1756 [Pseudomonadota bacterium]|jgi:hypothetical protein